MHDYFSENLSAYDRQCFNLYTLTTLISTTKLQENEQNSRMASILSLTGIIAGTVAGISELLYAGHLTPAIIPAHDIITW